eukprot:NODE_1247_length_1216_cov_114.803770_g915_i1.p2 GENE.NODE_1247_length_1216_cov_114.803770_g915_i1~~NODE_1247_length_1216_cov_114.803770_g915_i1.p2  ORF type:complete len:97 (-),score=37.58 NODE_1247_length_1216_cov_114.803770_g915_i1:159-449(-)
MGKASLVYELLAEAKHSADEWMYQLQESKEQEALNKAMAAAVKGRQDEAVGLLECVDRDDIADYWLRRLTAPEFPTPYIRGTRSLWEEFGDEASIE